jgi:hypothetical protein
VSWHAGEDHDRFGRTKQGWRLVSRSYINLFTQGQTITIPQVAAR